MACWPASAARARPSAITAQFGVAMPLMRAQQVGRGEMVAEVDGAQLSLRFADLRRERGKRGGLDLLPGESLIDRESHFTGNYRTPHNLRIDGRYEGEIECHGTVFVGESATVKVRCLFHEEQKRCRRTVAYGRLPRATESAFGTPLQISPAEFQRASAHATIIGVRRTNVCCTFIIPFNSRPIGHAGAAHAGARLSSASATNAAARAWSARASILPFGPRPRSSSAKTRRGAL